MSLKISGVRSRGRRRSTVQDRSYTNPGKGLDLFGSEEFIGDSEASSAMNAFIVETGSVSKPFGWEEVGTGLTGAPRGLMSYYPTGSDSTLVTIDSTDLVLKYLSGSVWQTAAGGITFGTTAKVCGVQAGGALWVWNGVNSGTKLLGTTASRPTTTVRGAFGVYYSDKQIVSGVAEHPNRLYISSPIDAGDFTNTNPTGTGPYSVYDANTHPGASTFAGSDAAYIDIALDDGDKITGLGKYVEQLIIVKERAIYAMLFEANGNPAINLVTSSVGCVSDGSIDSSDNDIIFLGRRAWFVFGAQQNFFNQLRHNELSIQLRPLVKSITPTNLDKSSGIWFDNVYHCAISVGNAAMNNRAVTYQRQYGAWFPHNNVQANAFTAFIGADNEEHLYYADENDPKVWKQTTGYAHGTNTIAMFWESKSYDFGKWALYKRFIDVTLLFRQLSGSVDVTITIDGSKASLTKTIPGTRFAGGMGRGLLGKTLFGGASESGVGDSSSTTTNIPIRIDLSELSQPGRAIKVKVANSNVNENFVLLGLEFGYRPYGRSTFDSALRVY